MKFYGFYMLTEFSTAMILLLIYSGVLWHTSRGSKFTFIYLIISLLIFSNIALAVYGIESYKIYSADGATQLDLVVSGIC